jgi:hypothetical protein
MRNVNFVLALVTVAACSNSEQVLTGRVEQNFPSQITEARIVHGGTVVATSGVASDGSFTLSVAPSKSLTLELVGTGKDGVVFPRSTGTIDRTFAVHAAGPAWDLGTVRFIGNSTTTSFSFKATPNSTDCHDGKDATGATCVDDEDDSHGTCESDDDGTETEASDANDGMQDDGDAVADHNFPADGCTETGDGSGEGSGSGD